MATRTETRRRPPQRADDEVRSKAANSDVGLIVPITAGEAILRRERREISILVAREEVTITHARYAAGEQVAGPHVHHEHTDTFYELEGELTLVIGARGRDRHGLLRRIRRRAARGSPLLPQRQRPARELAHHPHTRRRLRRVHARLPRRRQGRVGHLRGPRRRRPASKRIDRQPDGAGERRESGDRLCRLRCTLPDMCVVEWRLRGPHLILRFHRQDRHVDSFFLIEGELEAMLAGGRQTVGRGTLLSLPRGARQTLDSCGPARADPEPPRNRRRLRRAPLPRFGLNSPHADPSGR